MVKTTKGKLEMKRKLGFQSQEFAVDKFSFGGLSMEAKVNIACLQGKLQIMRDGTQISLAHPTLQV